MPIETLDHLQNFYILFKKVFVTTHVREDLGKHEMENFGVQQLPLFNILKLEDLDWLVCLS